MKLFCLLVAMVLHAIVAVKFEWTAWLLMSIASTLGLIYGQTGKA